MSHDDSSVSTLESLGILEVLGSGSGFIRRRDAGYSFLFASMSQPILGLAPAAPDWVCSV